MDLRQAISDTLKYADYFHYPLTSREIHYWLTTPCLTPFATIRPLLPPKLTKSQRSLRSLVLHSSEQKRSHARRLAATLRFVPGLRLVALTGSVAAGNSYPNDDIDLFFITSPHCLWLVRPLVIILISIFFRRRHPGEDHSKAANAFCPNLWLDSLSLAVPENKRNLYTAHEVLQTIPLLDRGDTYLAFLHENRWAKRFLANAFSSLASAHKPLRSAEILYNLFAPLNYIFYLIQLLYMNPKKTSEVVHLHAAFLHTTDFASAISHHLKTSKDI
ncbi:hypothetical protein A3K29_01145 [Candidatus Collierbacteria bacterium RIFOXYB2_FULL_46_14]|uniref:Polymerase nucleotidyl transferase domain-containing protein n=1 Tax=Candidatus Collierbacteria bacterium GW2011_GWA2_46_26 TaxID=1618381 RepID=A0A0G1RS31_9BACT|nr:MAG: hypothetical protein UW29_C0009G0031 [Candidatus Collierbacteria bacterium GW2011_GWC2_44_13]KKU32758.1 MAG: hypothetical protein UX47_C0007G0002 [Candidatus Collierbacteria bacterium GW2011_GWA2_46_26]OGD72737.1 MAG: hypothetical protein A3K29_01145 [Candidatus Collierbacteria bacterium RIFOXYB2_FULL_46_14]OGD75779.1 MAG: hypothetical protein A3K43_01145 [Candidatus Collierbacteria bacterium RIFOXYA2_FULL_46_20]OGD77115.1 MAG: hypothetical protein A3K39_01145 [Candidatus Collierbacteri